MERRVDMEYVAPVCSCLVQNVGKSEVERFSRKQGENTLVLFDCPNIHVWQFLQAWCQGRIIRGLGPPRASAFEYEMGRGRGFVLSTTHRYAEHLEREIMDLSDDVDLTALSEVHLEVHVPTRQKTAPLESGVDLDGPIVAGPSRRALSSAALFAVILTSEQWKTSAVNEVLRSGLPPSVHSHNDYVSGSYSAFKRTPELYKAFKDQNVFNDKSPSDLGDAIATNADSTRHAAVSIVSEYGPQTGERVLHDSNTSYQGHTGVSTNAVDYGDAATAIKRVQKAQH